MGAVAASSGALADPSAADGLDGGKTIRISSLFSGPVLTERSESSQEAIDRI
jgi:hypothetical protein